MTRDDGRGPEPVRLEPKEIHPPRKGCRGARRRARRTTRTKGGLAALARAWHQRACPPPAPPSRHAYVLRVHTLTCHHRVETELIEVNLLLSFLLPPGPLARLVQGSQVERAVVIRDAETWRPPVKTGPSKVSRADSAGLFFVGVSFARAGYRGQFVTEIRAGPFYRRNNYFKALRAPARRRRPFCKRPVDLSAASPSFLNAISQPSEITRLYSK